jgi:membrane protease YdiL (CAAX protease family)
MRELVRRHRIACFVIATYAITWSAWLPLAFAGHRVTAGFVPAYVLGLFGPMLAALATTAIADGRAGVRELVGRMLRVRAGLRWWIVALGMPLAIAAVSCVMLAAYAVFLIAPVSIPTLSSLGQFNGFPITNALVMWLALVAAGFGEETGWRGFLLPHVQRTRSPLVASLLVGVVWAAWHAPAFFVADTYRAMPVAMLPVFFVSLLCGSIFLAWLYNRGRTSILLVAVWHGTFNLLSGSVGARGALAAVESTAVMIVAAVLVIQELRADRRDRTGRPAHHAMTAT